LSMADLQRSLLADRKGSVLDASFSLLTTGSSKSCLIPLQANEILFASANDTWLVQDGSSSTIGIPAELQTSNARITTREDWLLAAATMLRPLFEENEIVLPKVFRISCGWPLSTQRGSRGRSHVIGQCWPQKASKDGAAEIFISPELDKGVTVTAVLVHELIHSADDCKNGHRGPFRKMAIAVGLSGPMRATVPGPELAERLNALCNDLGPYPHARLDATQVSRKQRTRLIKVVCNRPGHGYPVWTTRMWLDLGTPTCVCGASMSEITRKV
jgi:hypothetical protein